MVNLTDNCLDFSQEVYEPAEDSYLLQKSVRKLAFGRVLDMGTGSGIQAFEAVGCKDVRTVLAVDVNPNAVNILESKVKNEHINKLRVIESDLFSKVEGQFDTIIFNPPYLPQDKVGDKKINDLALYGGKNGYEVIQRFLNQSGEHLAQDGAIILLVSNLSGLSKIKEIITSNLFGHELLEEISLPFFEKLYVYKIWNSDVRKALISRSVSNISFLAKGQRGLVFKGKWKKNSFVKTHLAKDEITDVAIKIVNPKSNIEFRIENEVNCLKKLNREGIGPRLYFYGQGYFVMGFLEGLKLPEFLESEKKLISSDKLSEKSKSVLKEVLRQCYVLDKLGISKEEFHRPIKHVMISEDLKVTLLDFERCHNSEKPNNVSQFCTFLAKLNRINSEELFELAGKYKKSYSIEDFNCILGAVERA